VDCPTLQANLTGSGFTERAAQKLRQGFPAFEATLAPGGHVRMTVRGADKLELPAQTSVTWDVRVDAPVHAK
jgi:predicted RNase H-like nuclease